MFGTIVSILIASVFAVVLMVAEHYAPWARWLSGNAKPHPVLNYVQGLLGILLPFSALAVYWQVSNFPVSPLTTALAAWSISIAAGASVVACYAVDSNHSYRVRAREAEERERLANDQLERI